MDVTADAHSCVVWKHGRAGTQRSSPRRGRSVPPTLNQDFKTCQHRNPREDAQTARFLACYRQANPASNAEDEAALRQMNTREPAKCVARPIRRTHFERAVAESMRD
jgi:hypothetical protein